MELCDSTLLRFLERGANHKELNERALAFVFRQCLLACQHIHERGVVHRDIKPDNYMVQGQQVKMCDFGLSAVLGEGGRMAGLTGICGTAPYIAPEMLQGQRYSTPVDLWSVGVMTHTLFFGDFPYNGTERTARAMKRAIRDGDKKPTFEPGRHGGAVAPRVSEAAVELCRGLLHRSPGRRWKVDQALSCEFVVAGEEIDESLPSLLPVLHIAKHAGVFDKRRLELPDELDALLHRLHTEIRGVPMDAAPRKEGRGDYASETSTSFGASLPSNLWKRSDSTSTSTSTTGDQSNWQRMVSPFPTPLVNPSESPGKVTL